MIRALMGGHKCRTIDITDIFGDNSGKHLYRLDGNANDEAGAVHLTESNASYSGGQFERCGQFASNTILNNTSYSDMFANSLWSYSLWIEPSAVSSNVYMPISTPGGYIGINAGSLSVMTRDSGGYKALTPSFTVAVNSRYHIVVVGDSTSCRYYVNTVYVGSVAITLPYVTYTSNTLQFGGSAGGSSATYTGKIDQVRIFNRALTLTEIAFLYQECAPSSILNNPNPFEDNSLKAMYQFDGNANDLTGVYNGTPTNVTWGTGKFGQCAVFDGTAKIANTSSINMTDDIAISFWIKTTSTLASTHILSINESTTKTLHIRVDSGNTLRVGYGLSTTTTNNVVITQYSFPSASNGAWHHVVISKRNGVLSLYVNGTYCTLSAFATGNGSVVQGLLIGANPFSGNAELVASIEQVRIHNKALTPMEVASLYTETTPLEEPLSALVDPFKDFSGVELFRMEGNSLAESGRASTGTAMSYTASPLGGRCKACSKATLSYISAPSLVLGATSSISFWAMRNTTDADQVIITSDANFFIAGNYTSYWIKDTASTTNFEPLVAGAMLPSINTWYHVVFTDNGSSIKAYRNGVEIANKTAYNSISGMIFNYVGSYTSATPSLSGAVDQVRIFNRALTLAEVQTLYTKGA